MPRRRNTYSPSLSKDYWADQDSFFVFRSIFTLIITWDTVPETIHTLLMFDKNILDEFAMLTWLNNSNAAAVYCELSWRCSNAAVHHDYFGEWLKALNFKGPAAFSWQFLNNFKPCNFPNWPHTPAHSVPARPPGCSWILIRFRECRWRFTPGCHLLTLRV